MAIEASCSCGGQFKVKSNLAGKRVKCPKCGQSFVVPASPVGTAPNATPAAAKVVPINPIVVQCVCGSSFQAEPYLAGKTLGCPKCGQQLTVPNVQPLADPFASPLTTAAPTVDPFAQPSPMLPQANLMPQANTLQPMASPTTPAHPAPIKKKRKKKRKARNREVEEGIVLEYVTAGLSIYHGGWATYYLLGALIVLIQLGGIGLSFFSIVFVFFLPSVAIFIAGIGILARQQWAIPVGGIASYCYLGILCFGLLLSIPAMLADGLSAAPGLRGVEVSSFAVIYGLFQLAGNLAGPLLLAGLYQGQN